MSKKLFLHLEKQNTKVSKNKSDKKVTKEVKGTESNQLNMKEVTDHTKENSIKQTKNKKDIKKRNIKASKDSIIGNIETSQQFEEDENTGSENSSYDSGECGEEIIKLIVEEKKSRKRKTVLSDDGGEGNTIKSEDTMDSSNINHTLLSGISSFFNPGDKETSDSSSDDEENVSIFVI